jgi:hypothetical protein
VLSKKKKKSIAQAGVAKWLECACGKVRWAVELDCNSPIDDSQVYAEQAIGRGVLEPV